MPEATRRFPRAHRALALPAAFVVGAAIALAAAGAPAQAAPAPTTATCGYGQGGPQADTLCWLDMSGYDPALAAGPGGQSFSDAIPGGYTVTFDLTSSGRPVTQSIFPTWDYGAAIGVDIYLNTPGQPALYQDPPGAAETILTMANLQVRDSDGNVVHGWRIVGADAEATAADESLTFTADTPVSVLAAYEKTPGLNGCQANVILPPVAPPNSISCTGAGLTDDYGTLLVSATEPTTFTQTLDAGAPNAREGVAFAFQVAKVAEDVSVTRRALSSDAFTVAVTSPENSVVGTASTGPGASASTGQVEVLPRTVGGAYLFSVAGVGSTDLTAYDFSWSCARNGVVDPSLAARGVTSVSVVPAAGELVACTVTASVAPPRLASTGVSATPILLTAGLLLMLGAAVLLIARRRRTA